MLSPSTVKPRNEAFDEVIVTTAPEVVFVDAGRNKASATRVPVLGEILKLGPRTSTALPIVTFSV